jgi:hypothetical protein
MGFRKSFHHEDPMPGSGHLGWDEKIHHGDTEAGVPSGEGSVCISVGSVSPWRVIFWWMSR